uniref:Cytochrome c oxidase subunit 3 n=3 Tax=Bilateria TaxID=33213 RepID=A0A8A6C4G7_9HYME|nr:cytochrome c oxidase subunit III [Neostromboceros nipponicus]QTH79152.1 cytochrome c oxidase subunit III [Neostromboceros nipponicus]UQS76350.1 cytochrome c oxidase subunit III [Neostromboceros nipponicus]
MMLMMKNHPFHLVDYSPWPILGAFSTMILVSGSIMMFNFYNNNLFFLGLTLILLIMFQWWRDIIRESTFQGLHTKIVVNGLRWGMILFIISEIFFFTSFFWAFFHSSLSPSIEIGGLWPPKGIIPFNPMNIPLMNTLILISSGFSITWAHHSLMNNKKTETIFSLTITVLLGILFSLLQLYEYMEAPFTMADSIYGSTFFMATGFHGIHVLIGSTFIMINLLRLNFNHFSKNRHFGFEASTWYWHFVDVIWLFLYISIYWWGS